MPRISLKPWSNLVEEDFVQHPAWTDLYAPDELELLTSLGFDEAETKDVLAKVAWSEDYAFPLPAAGAAMPFMRLRVSARITTHGGSKLIGYMGAASVSAFHRGKVYSFNRGLRDLSQKQAVALGALLGEELIFPLQVELPALHETRSFSLA
jgi:hypothetical protein